MRTVDKHPVFTPFELQKSQAEALRSQFLKYVESLPEENLSEEKYWAEVHELRSKVQLQLQPLNRKFNSYQKDALLSDPRVPEKNKLIQLYCFHRGCVRKVAEEMRMPFTRVCQLLNPFVTNSLRILQNIINKRNLRKMAVRWGYEELREFKYRFLEVENGRLFGHSKRVNLTTFFKLMRMNLDTNVVVSNHEAIELYEGVLDLHFDYFYLQQQKSLSSKVPVNWTRDEIKFFCFLVKKTNSLQIMVNLMVKEYNQPEKFAEQKLLTKLESILKGALGKIKQQSMLYPSTGQLEKIDDSLLRFVIWGTNEIFTQIRVAMINYFLANNPPLSETFQLIGYLNILFQENNALLATNNSHSQTSGMNIENYTEQEVEMKKLLKIALASPTFFNTKIPVLGPNSKVESKSEYRLGTAEQLKFESATNSSEPSKSNIKLLESKISSIRAQRLKKEKQLKAYRQTLYSKVICEESDQQVGKIQQNKSTFSPLNPFETQNKSRFSQTLFVSKNDHQEVSDLKSYLSLNPNSAYHAVSGKGSVQKGALVDSSFRDSSNFAEQRSFKGKSSIQPRFPLLAVKEQPLVAGQKQLQQLQRSNYQKNLQELQSEYSDRIKNDETLRGQISDILEGRQQSENIVQSLVSEALQETQSFKSTEATKESRFGTKEWSCRNFSEQNSVFDSVSDSQGCSHPHDPFKPE